MKTVHKCLKIFLIFLFYNNCSSQTILLKVKQQIQDVACKLHQTNHRLFPHQHSNLLPDPCASQTAVEPVNNGENSDFKWNLFKTNNPGGNFDDYIGLNIENSARYPSWNVPIIPPDLNHFNKPNYGQNTDQGLSKPITINGQQYPNNQGQQNQNFPYYPGQQNLGYPGNNNGQSPNGQVYPNGVNQGQWYPNNQYNPPKNGGYGQNNQIPTNGYPNQGQWFPYNAPNQGYGQNNQIPNNNHGYQYPNNGQLYNNQGQGYYGQGQNHQGNQIPNNIPTNQGTGQTNYVPNNGQGPILNNPYQGNYDQGYTGVTIQGNQNPSNQGYGENKQIPNNGQGQLFNNPGQGQNAQGNQIPNNQGYGANKQVPSNGQAQFYNNPGQGNQIPNNKPSDQGTGQGTYFPYNGQGQLYNNPNQGNYGQENQVPNSNQGNAPINQIPNNGQGQLYNNPNQGNYLPANQIPYNGQGSYIPNNSPHHTNDPTTQPEGNKINSNGVIFPDSDNPLLAKIENQNTTKPVIVFPDSEQAANYLDGPGGRRYLKNLENSSTIPTESITRKPLVANSTIISHSSKRRKNNDDYSEETEDVKKESSEEVSLETTSPRDDSQPVVTADPNGGKRILSNVKSNCQIGWIADKNGICREKY